MHPRFSRHPLAVVPLLRLTTERIAGATGRCFVTQRLAARSQRSTEPVFQPRKAEGPPGPVPHATSVLPSGEDGLVMRKDIYQEVISKFRVAL